MFKSGKKWYTNLLAKNQLGTSKKDPDPNFLKPDQRIPKTPHPDFVKTSQEIQINDKAGIMKAVNFDLFAIMGL